ncbi:MAG: DUF2299 family protein [Promethearchaeota archaeon]
MNSEEVFTQIKKWTMKEQIFKLVLEAKDKISWAIELTYPFNHPNPVAIVILNPKNRDFIGIQIRIRMSPPHFKRMEKKGLGAFNLYYHKLRKVFLEKDVTFNINNVKNEWIASDQIHFDGLTKHEFFKTIRRVHNSIILGNILIDEVLNTTIINAPKGKPPGKGKNSFNQGNLYS